MEQSVANTPPVKKRIGSIDALRAITLLGIFVVHAHTGFGTHLDYSTAFDCRLQHFIDLFLVSRCSIIFNILFGVSFYIILKKKDYPSSKFVWRCFLLFLLGLFNKFFYWPDALMFYGLSGMVLVAVRPVKTRYLLWIVLLLYVATYFLRDMHLENLLPNYVFEGNRCSDHPSFSVVLSSQPNAVYKYVHHILKSGIFWCLANMIIGYWIGRMGFVEKMDRMINGKFVLVTFALFVFGMCINAYFLHFFIRVFRNLTGFLFYSSLFVYIYNRLLSKSSIRLYLENYGKLGLTNYSFQGMIAIILLCHLGLGFIGLPPCVIIGSSVVLFMLQAVFSSWWLSRYRNGPLEWLWRCATERSWLPIRK